MATLPIAFTEIMPPYRPSHFEDADYLRAKDGTTQTVRQGGHVFQMALTLKPINLLIDAAHINELEVFLDGNPVFDVPLRNLQSGNTAGVWTVNGAHTVGATVVALTPGTGTLQVGQHLQLGAFSKVYKVKNWDGANLTLDKPLRQNLNNGDAVTYSAIDGKGNAFSGVMATFRNEDFGDTAPGYPDGPDGGIIARFGPYSLVEAI